MKNVEGGVELWNGAAKILSESNDPAHRAVL
jgi:hypothetical protein